MPVGGPDLLAGVPTDTAVGGRFLRWQWGFSVPSPAAFGKINDAYVAKFRADHAIPVVYSVTACAPSLLSGLERCKTPRPGPPLCCERRRRIRSRTRGPRPIRSIRARQSTAERPHRQGLGEARVQL